MMLWFIQGPLDESARLAQSVSLLSQQFYSDCSGDLFIEQQSYFASQAWSVASLSIIFSFIYLTFLLPFHLFSFFSDQSSLLSQHLLQQVWQPHLFSPDHFIEWWSGCSTSGLTCSLIRIPLLKSYNLFQQWAHSARLIQSVMVLSQKCSLMCSVQALLNENARMVDIWCLRHSVWIHLCCKVKELARLRSFSS